MIKKIAVNRKARFNYQVIDQYEAGLSLIGSEVKSIRGGEANINDCYIQFDNQQLPIVIGMYIKEYKESSYNNHEPRRERKLLLKKKEIKKMRQHIEKKGNAIIPLEMYFNNKWIKLKIGFCVGKKLHDKRETIKKRDSEREIQRRMKR